MDQYHCGVEGCIGHTEKPEIGACDPCNTRPRIFLASLYQYTDVLYHCGEPKCEGHLKQDDHTAFCIDLEELMRPSPPLPAFLDNAWNTLLPPSSESVSKSIQVYWCNRHGCPGHPTPFDRCI